MNPDGLIVEYRWIISGSDERTVEITGPTATHVFLEPGDYDVVLEVIDDRGGAGFTGAGGVALEQLYDASGPLNPVDPPPEFNLIRAGRTIPLRWTLLWLADGSPVADAASFDEVTLRQVSCDSGLL